MSDTSSIDEKKQDNSSSSKSFASNIINFTISILVIFAIILLYFSSGGLILYLCKLAQTNILPTDINCAPYTDAKPNIQEIQTNIFTTHTDPEMSMKLQFPYNKNTKNKIIDMFKEYKDKPSSNFLGNYFISITESLLQFNYSAMNTIMNSMNGFLPETVIILLGPIIGAFLYGFGLLINQIYFIYLWFSSMYWFFKHNSNDTGAGLPKWENVTLFNPIDWWLGALLAFIFVILLFFGFPILTFIPIFAYHASLLSSLFYKGIMNDKSATALTIIINVLKYYKLSVVITISFFVILLAFSNLGIAPGIFSILTVALIYWGVISFNTFKPITEENLSPLVSYEQATKICSNKYLSHKKHGLLYNLLGLSGGGNIAKEIKKIGKNLSAK